jgi:mandelamide amidase
MARSVADLILLDEVITQTRDEVAPPAPAQLRLGIEREHFWADLDANVRAVMDQALRRLSAAGVELVEVTMPGFASLSEKAGFPVSLHEVRQDLSAYLAQWNTGFRLETLAARIASPDVKDIFDRLVLGPEAVSAASYRAALEEFQPALRWLYDDSFRRYHLDALIFPTTPLPAQMIGTSDKTVTLNGRSRSTFDVFVHNTYPGANAGIPGLSLPAGLTAAGLPVGIEIDGPAGSDRRLLGIGLALEALLPRRPAPPSQN